MGLLIKQLKKLFKIKEKNEMNEPNSLTNYFHLAHPGSLLSKLRYGANSKEDCEFSEDEIR